MNYVKINDKRQFERFMIYLESLGFKWRDGSLPTQTELWEQAVQNKETVKGIIVDPQNNVLTYWNKANESIVTDHISTKEFRALGDTKEEQPVIKHYRLLKDTIDLKKSTVVRETGQVYRLVDKSGIKFTLDQSYPLKFVFSKEAVENQPKYFEEVTRVTPVFMNVEQRKKLSTFLKRSK